jgi:hypothetical protein
MLSLQDAFLISPGFEVPDVGLPDVKTCPRPKAIIIPLSYSETGAPRHMGVVRFQCDTIVARDDLHVPSGL